MAANQRRTHDMPRSFRRIGFLYSDPSLLAIAVRIRLQRQGEFVLHHDRIGRVFSGSSTDVRARNYPRINAYRWPCDREWIEQDLRQAFTAWNTEQIDGKAKAATSCP
jgi:hypothetical protein